MSSVLITSDEYDHFCAMQWKPIETAPKDQTPVLINVHNGVAIAVRNDAIFGGWQCCAVAHLFEEGWDMEKCDIALPNPTSWMPLPKPFKGEVK
jgi:hypothetical protein